jgi:integrase
VAQIGGRKSDSHEIQSRIDAEVEAGHLLQANHESHHQCEFIVSLQTGTRCGEQYGLEWPDVDLKRRQIHVRESKNGTERYIPMLPKVVLAFKKLKAVGLTRKDRAKGQPNEASEACGFALADPKKLWTTLLRGPKVKKYRWHDNRQTFCSRMVQAGKNLKVVQELAGHRDIKMSARYAHLDQGFKSEALEDAFEAE